METKAGVSYECEYDKLRAKNITHNKTFMKSLNFAPLIPRWKCRNPILRECEDETHTPDVATPLWAKCEDETHTPKSGNLESSGTPENSDLDYRGQNTLHCDVLYIVGKVLNCRCPKWPHMSHLDICSLS
jgi:hypothetical protein